MHLQTVAVVVISKHVKLAQRDCFSLGTIHTLGQPDHIDATRELADAFQLPRNKLVDISELLRRLMCKQRVADNGSVHADTRSSARRPFLRIACTQEAGVVQVQCKLHSHPNT
jgi:hypothetical protein